jgi:exonuclease III
MPRGVSVAKTKPSAHPLWPPNLRHRGLRFGSWNTAGGLDQETKLLDYAFGVCDVLGLQETKRELTFMPDRIISGEAPSQDDSGSGVAILLSERASSMLVESGCDGSRIVWCRLSGPSHDMVCVNAYVPYETKEQPSQRDILERLRKVLRHLQATGKASDCLVLLGDFNSRLPRNFQGLTGRYAQHAKADAGGLELLDIMREFHLTAASTRFCPSRRKSPRGSTTYISPRQAGYQIDYALISRDRFSAVTECKVDWAHARHRWGYERDHGTIVMTVRFKIRAAAAAPPPPPNLTLLSDPKNPKVLETFDRVLTDTVRAAKEAAGGEEGQGPDRGSDTATDYAIMIEALHRAEETIPRLPKPKREGSTPASDETKTLFKAREATLAALAQGTQEFCDTRKDYAQQISKAQRKDKRNELKAAAQELEEAATKHAHPRTIQAALRKLSRKPTHRRKRMVQPSRSSKSGGAGAELFASQEELLAAWRSFDAEKFSATPMETRRGSMPGLGPADASDVPTDEDLEICLEAREGNKSCGPDEIPTELYKCSAESKALLFALIKKIWVREDTPAAMVQGLFVHIFKNKGSQDDMTKYRCICLLNHAFKVMSAYLLLRTLREVGHNLDPSQWGFRKERGTRDAVTLVREIIRWALKEQKSLILVFLDFQAAFDTVSHKFLDEALSSAGASRKTRAIFRDIYVKATARVKIRAPDGRTLLSDSFSVDRGVVQGDIFSPLCFILALALIMKRHGVSSQGLGAFGLLMDHVDYADDVAQCETSAEEASERLTRIAMGARGDADMIISVEKTKAMHVRPRMELGVPSEQDYEDLWASRKKGGLTVEACKFCGRKFPNVAGRATHETLHCSHRFSQQWVVERIVDVRGPPEARFFKVKWEGDWDEVKGYSWRKEGELELETAVEQFWATSALDRTQDIEVDGEWRCKRCGWITTKGPGPLKTHQKKNPVKGGCKERAVGRKGSKAERTVMTKMQQDAQSRLPKVFCEGEQLENVFDFVYLGSGIQADGDEEVDPDRRMAIAKSSFFDLGDVWKASDVGTGLKLRFYAAGIISILTYGAETWLLTDRLVSRLRNWNARCLSRITGRSVREEHVDPTFDLIPRLLSRRLKWLGHVLRAEEGHYVKSILCAQADLLGGEYKRGTVLAEAPGHTSAEELLDLARDKDLWREITFLDLPGGAGTQAKGKSSKTLSDAFMVANGYFFQNGAWTAYSPQQQQQEQK